MRIAAAFLMTALLTACGPETGLTPLPMDQVRARFPPGKVVNVIEVDAVDRLPLRTAELVAPDGEATPAFYLYVNPSPNVTYYQRFPSSPYGDSTFGIGDLAAGVPFPADLAGAPQGNQKLLAMVSTASIRLPDEVAYRRDWRSYRIFLSFGDLAGEVARRVITAPEPPPQPPSPAALAPSPQPPPPPVAVPPPQP
jgi:hypothetical protein